ncbi:MAG: type II toxin-antitoxin system YoeB family toxin [Eubacteriaceae bacterium]|nr:type II toxin-antitoxin system YoeB family toxin [Eubacteriaceae bacterium]
MKVPFSQEAFEDYAYWQSQDKKTLKRINRLIDSISRDPNALIGKAEILKGDKQEAKFEVSPCNYNLLIVKFC